MSSNPEINARHGVICALPTERFGYFGWPSVARQQDGTLVAAASGRRFQHVCPWGKSVLCASRDDGQTWSGPTVVNNTPLDDRDAGIISLGGQRLALTWFTSDTTVYRAGLRKSWAPDDMRVADAIMDSWTVPMRQKWIGSWIRISEDGEYWGDFLRAPVNTPHGFIVLADGSWLYLGKRWDLNDDGTMHVHGSPIQAARSADEGKSWTLLGRVPLAQGLCDDDTHEPHVVELADGALLGFLRHHKPFQILTTKSTDGGLTWSPAQPGNILGSPPHALRHSSGAIVCVYGYRLPPYGQRAMISRDNGGTWQHDIILRDDGPDGDLGYPASVELPGGDILTVYYQKLNPGDKKCSLLYTRWQLPL